MSEPGRSDAGFDFFAAPELPVPTMSEREAADLAATLLGRPVVAHLLGSQQDANFLLSAAGTAVGVLKVANAAFSETEVDCQDRAAAHLAAALPELRFATALDGVRVRVAAGVDRGAAVDSVARVLTFLPGGTLSGSGYLHPTTVAEFGRLAGRVSVALQDFVHPGTARTLQWYLPHADRALDALLPAVTGEPERHLVQRVRDETWPLVAELAPQLPMQVVHGDFSDDNVVCRDDDDGVRIPDGVIDFGDTGVSWAVSELAIAVASLLHHDGVTPVGALAAAREFHRVRPLSEAEADALWPLVTLRAAVLVASGHQQLAIDGGVNDYVAAGLQPAQRILEQATSMPTPVMQAAVREVLGLARPVASLPANRGCVVAGLDGVAHLDLSVTSDLMDGGRWTDHDAEGAAAIEALDAGASAVTTRFGEFRLTRAVPLSRTAPATAPTGIDVWFARSHDVVAPWAGTVVRTADGITLAADGQALRLSGPAVLSGPIGRETVERGAVLGAVAARGRLRVTVVRGQDIGAVPDFVVPDFVVPDFVVPDFVVPELVPAWSSLLCDPGPLLTEQPVDVEPGPARTDLLERRREHFAELQEHYYRSPPQIERGWREHLVSVTGRSYLDMVNNVAALGHGDPRFADAVARQLRRLNTNSRFNYRAVVDFSERLAGTLPDPLDTVFLVNSGSEAVDLALRIAIAATDRRDVVAVGEAYHGWTYASDAVSTSTADNPDAMSTRPDWVHVVDAPNSYRGRYRGADADRYALDAVDHIDALAAAGRPPAAFLCEPFFGNAGGLALPDGYLDAVYGAVRRHGGLAVADEVQVGYGRLGHWFWGFEQQRVVPDIVTIAKAMGNGHPLGAVITSRDVAERYRSQGYFFSSAGGSPVSSIVGSAVLNAIRRERLQDNARDVGDHLIGRLEELRVRHALIGAVHGSGLYIGVELVRDRRTLEPATEETARLCDRLLELGVIVQATGDRLCVLKVKPPLVLGRDAADFFVDALDHALSTGF